MKDDSVVTMGIRITKKLNKKLKQLALDTDKSVKEIAVEAFEEYLKKHQRRN